MCRKHKGNTTVAVLRPKQLHLVWCDAEDDICL